MCQLFVNANMDHVLYRFDSPPIMENTLEHVVKQILGPIKYQLNYYYTVSVYWINFFVESLQKKFYAFELFRVFIYIWTSKRWNCFYFLHHPNKFKLCRSDKGSKSKIWPRFSFTSGKITKHARYIYHMSIIPHFVVGFLYNI